MFFTGSNNIHCARQLFRISFGLCKVLNNGQFIHSGAVTKVRFKDIVPATTVPAASQDILFQNVRSAKESSEVLCAIERHHSIMNSNHALQALKSLFILQKHNSSRLSNGEIVRNKDFRKLCEVLQSQIRHVELDELIDGLKCLAYLGVQADMKLVNIILNLISKQVNDLSLQQIKFLDFIMKDFKATPLVQALRIALPIVFEANLQRKCDFDNISQLGEFLYFVARQNLEKSADIIVDALTQKREEVTEKEARNIVFALCEFKYHRNEKYNLLLCHILDIITDSIDKFDFYDLELTLSKLLTRYLEYGNVSCYHEEFCNGCAQMIVNRDCSFEQSLWILKRLTKFNHIHLPLLDHVAGRVEKEPWLLEQGGATAIICFISGFSSADYKPRNWDRIKSLVIKACQGLMDRSELPWLRLVLDLCIMDCWSEELFQKVFSREFLTSFMAREYNKIDRIQLLQLDQVSSTLSPWPIKPRAPADILAPILERSGSHITTFPLQAALCRGLGGQQYVHSGVHTHLGHFLDHVVVMRKGGFPVAINSAEDRERVSIDDIQVPADSKMVAVLFVPSSMYATNNERVKGMFRIFVNSVEVLGISVAPILQTVWTTLPDFERIPYLMRAIQQKMPSTEITNVVTPP